MLNTKSPIPLYYQISEILMNRIKSGEYSAGDKIPSEPTLVKEFGVGRPTIRQAISVLIKKRVLESRRGSGTYVCEGEDVVDLFSLSGTSHAFLEKGINVQVSIIQNVSLKKVKNKHNNPFNGAKAYCLSRLNSVDDCPVLVEEIYLHPEVFAGFDAVNYRDSLSKIIRDVYNMEPSCCRQTFRVICLDGKLADLLGMKNGQSVLQVDRYLTFNDIEDAIYSRIVCRTDRFAFSQKLEGGTQ